jgi:hypothetical protein
MTFMTIGYSPHVQFLKFLIQVLLPSFFGEFFFNPFWE